MIDTYKIRRPSLIGHHIRGIGELVPEAHLWRLVDTLVRYGRLLKVSVTEAEFMAAVDKFCPDEADVVYDAVGLEPLEMPAAPDHGKVRGTRKVLVSRPEPITVELPA